MAPSRAPSSRAQPCTSPMANTASPVTSNGAVFQSAISTGSVTGGSMPLMLHLSGAALHRGRAGLGRTAVELFLHDTVEFEAQRRLVGLLYPDTGGQHVLVVSHTVDSDIGQPHDALVAFDQFFKPRDRRVNVLVGGPGEAQL